MRNRKRMKKIEERRVRRVKQARKMK